MKLDFIKNYEIKCNLEDFFVNLKEYQRGERSKQDCIDDLKSIIYELEKEKS